MPGLWHGPNRPCGCCCTNLIAYWGPGGSTGSRDSINGGEWDETGGYFGGDEWDILVSVEVNMPAGTAMGIQLANLGDPGGGSDLFLYAVVTAAGEVFPAKGLFPASFWAIGVIKPSGLTAGNWHKVEIRRRELGSFNQQRWDFAIYVDDVEIARYMTGGVIDIPFHDIVNLQNVSAWSTVEYYRLGQYTTEPTPGQQFFVDCTVSNAPVTPTPDTMADIQFRNLWATLTQRHDADCPRVPYAHDLTDEQVVGGQYPATTLTVAGTPHLDGTYPPVPAGGFEVQAQLFGGGTDTWAAAPIAGPSASPLVDLPLFSFARTSLSTNYFVVSAAFDYFIPQTTISRGRGYSYVIFDLNDVGNSYPFNLSAGNAVYSMSMMQLGNPNTNGFVEQGELLGNGTFTVSI